MRRDRVGEAFGDPPLEGAHIDPECDAVPGRVFATIPDESMGNRDGTWRRHLEAFHQLERDGDDDDGSRRERPADTLPLALNAVDVVRTEEFVEASPFYAERLGNDRRAVRSHNYSLVSENINARGGASRATHRALGTQLTVRRNSRDRRVSDQRIPLNRTNLLHGGEPNADREPTMFPRQREYLSLSSRNASLARSRIATCPSLAGAPTHWHGRDGTGSHTRAFVRIHAG